MKQELIKPLQHISDDDFDEFQVVIAHLFGDYSDKINKFALHFMHQDGFEIYNDKLRLNFYLWHLKIAEDT